MSYKISDLTALTTPATGDKLAVVDISDTTQAATGTTKVMTFSEFCDGIFTELGITPSVAELNFVDGVTSAIQTQIDNHLADTSTHGVSEVADAADMTTHQADTTTHGATGAVVGTTNTQTLTNKRITKRVTTITSHATPTVNTDNCDCVTITALAAAITSMTTNLSGTPTNFQTLIFRILDNGTARAITWGAKFEARGFDLPTTTTISKLLTVGFIYDTVDNIWGCVAVSEES